MTDLASLAGDDARTPGARTRNSARAHALAIEAVLADVAQKTMIGRKAPRAFPCRIRFWRSGRLVVCGLLSRDGVLAFGALDENRSGTWVPSPSWERTVREELEQETGWRTREAELDDQGLPTMIAAA